MEYGSRNEGGRGTREEWRITVGGIRITGIEGEDILKKIE